MNWKQLHYILTVAEEGSVTRAAKKLYLSQPSLSLSIKSLEDELDLPLFDREQGALRLTYAGRLFCDWARATLATYEQLECKLNDIAGGRRCLLRVGISPHRSSLLMPKILEQFYALHPACEIRLSEQPTYVLRRQLEEKALDMLIDTPHPDTAAFISEHLEMERVMLAIPQTFAAQLPPALQDAPALPLDALRAFPFIMMGEDQALGSLSRHVCTSNGFEPNIRLTCVGVENALGLVQHQLGIAFIPEIFSLKSGDSMNIRYYSVAGAQPERQICLVYPRDSYQNRPLKDLLQLFREWTPQLYRP